MTLASHLFSSQGFFFEALTTVYGGETDGDCAGSKEIVAVILKIFSSSLRSFTLFSQEKNCFGKSIRVYVYKIIYLKQKKTMRGQKFYISTYVCVRRDF